MLAVTKELIQPIGAHNPPEECVRTESVHHLIKYPFSHFNPMQSLYVPYVDEEEHNVVITAPTCSGKCLNKCSIVLTENGLLEIGEIGDGLVPGEYRENKETISTPLNDVHADTATQIYRDGESMSIRINTDIGFELTATPAHRIKVVSKDGDIVWKYMRDLVVGDVCVLAKGQKMFGASDGVSEEDAYFYGLLAGDGGMTTKDVIRFTNEDHHILEFFQEYSIARGLKVHNKDHRTSKTCRELTISNKNYKQKLEDLGFEAVYSSQKNIPKCIRTAPKGVVAAYIRGLFETDGWVQYSEKQNALALCIALSNKRLIEQIQIILLNFGIVATRRKKKTTHLDSHTLSIYPDSLPTFVSEIGLDPNGHKFEKLRKAMLYFSEKGTRKKYDISFNTHDLLMTLRSEMKKIGPVRSLLESSPIDHKTFESWSIQKAWRVPTKPMLRLLVQWIRKQTLFKSHAIDAIAEKLEFLLREDFVFSRVEKITEEMSDNYDFVVPETHSFVGNGFINHNTVCAELSIAQCVFGSGRKKKAIYLAPMKSLAEEKLADWGEEGHAFSGLNITALTSDYVLNDQKKGALENADIVLCTSEMLDSKSRSYQRNTWLHNVGVIVVDESHLLGAKERGPRLETAVMRYSKYNPNCRWVLMSATCPNFKDYVRWMNKLTGKKTVLVTSEYRPCLLEIDYIEVDDQYASRSKRYADMEMSRMHTALELVKKFPQDQCMIFVGNKTWGRSMLPMLRQAGFVADFHNADLPMEKRRQIEKDFNAGNIQVLIASSTLAWGVNVNARRVILAHTSYGLSPMGVEDILQVCGRAGRVRYHTQGNAYILLPSSKFVQEKARIQSGFEVKSKLNEIKPLVFHIVNEIDNGTVTNEKELHYWYEHSLAAQQGNVLRQETCAHVVQKLTAMKMIQEDPTGKLVTTPLGKVTSLMYQDPFNVYDWFKNFLDIEHVAPVYSAYDTGKEKDVRKNDYKVCYALANIDEYKSGSAFLSTSDKESPMVRDFCNATGLDADSAVVKIAGLYYYMMSGKDIDDSMRSAHFQLYNDLQRNISTLSLIHEKFGKAFTKNSTTMKGYKFDPSEWRILYERLKHGVPAYLTGLVALPGIGKVTAQKLYNAGIRGFPEVRDNPAAVEKIIGSTKAKKLYNTLGEMMTKKQ